MKAKFVNESFNSSRNNYSSRKNEPSGSDYARFSEYAWELKLSNPGADPGTIYDFLQMEKSKKRHINNMEYDPIIHGRTPKFKYYSLGKKKKQIGEGEDLWADVKNGGRPYKNNMAYDPRDVRVTTKYENFYQWTVVFQDILATIYNMKHDDVLNIVNDYKIEYHKIFKLGISPQRAAEDTISNNLNVTASIYEGDGNYYDYQSYIEH